MAAAGNFKIRHHRFLPTSSPPISGDSLELHESDFYPSGSTQYPNSPEFTTKKSSSSSSRLKRGEKKGSVSAASSMPVNVPDWSKILKVDNRRRESDDDDDDECDENGVVPPHEFLARQMARTRIVCFSVHEGVGRTLKGRDLSRVRNAIWEKTGFED